MSFLMQDGFLSSVGRYPDRIALEMGEEQYRYQELFETARSIASFLVDVGMGRNDRVAILASKGYEMYVSILGTLMAGCAYIPLDPEFPVSRLDAIVKDARPGVIIRDLPNVNMTFSDLPGVHSVVFDKIVGKDPESVLPSGMATDMAYILYTSGSTGKPKGVIITHQNVTGFIDWAISHYSITPDDRISNHPEVIFDMSIFDMFTAWGAGSSLFPVINQYERVLPVDFIKRNRITVWFSVPSILANIIMAKRLRPDYFKSLRIMLFAGEALQPSLIRQLMLACPWLRVGNLYGPTEATVVCAVQDLHEVPHENARAVSIGWRTGNTEIFLWNSDTGCLARPEEEGEIFIAGGQVSPGYWNNDAETEKRFVLDPRYPEIRSRCFRSGDLARFGRQGPEYIGRLDNQVNIHGFRVELGDIENSLINFKEITECVCIVSDKPENQQDIVAFVRCLGEFDQDRLIAGLKLKLPSYMIPAKIYVIEQFPRTATGKIDRQLIREKWILSLEE